MDKNSARNRIVYSNRFILWSQNAESSDSVSLGDGQYRVRTGVPRGQPAWGSGSDRVRGTIRYEIGRSLLCRCLLARVNPVATAPGTDSMTWIAGGIWSPLFRRLIE